MKIAFIGQKGIPVISGGVERRVEELSTRMVKKGHEVFVFSRNGYNSKKIKTYKGVQLIYLPTIFKKNFETIIHTFFATVYAIFSNFDVVHYQAPGPTSLSWLIKLFRPDIALVATFNSRDSKHQKWGSFAVAYLNFAEQIIVRIPDKTIVVSEILKKYVKDKFNRETIVIRNGATILESINKNKTVILEKYNLKKERYFLSVSRLISHKGIHYAMEAFDNAQKKGKIPQDFKLVIAGEGSYTDDYVKYLKKLSKINKNIILVGNQTGKNLALLFSNSFTFVQPSQAEGLSNSLLESMGYGKAPIISNIPENLTPVGENGFIFKNKDVADLERKIIFTIKNKKLVKELGRRAKNNIEEKYNWDKNVEITLDLYKKLVFQKNNNRVKIYKRLFN